MNRGAAGTPVFTFTDQTDYVGNSEAIADVKGAIKIEYGDTVYYDNTDNVTTDPDINGASVGQVNEALVRKLTKSTFIDLPTNSNGTIVSGQYKFTYVVVVGAAAPIEVSATVDATFTQPVGDLDAVVDLTPTSPSITVTDNTNYTVRNVAPTGTPQITLYYPADAGATPTVESGSILTVIQFYTGEQVAKLSADKLWDYTSKVIESSFTTGYFTLYIQDVITDRIAIQVESNNNICAVFCCLKAFSDRLLAAKSNPSKYKQLVDIAGQVSFFYNAIDAAYKCGKTESVNLWVNELRDLIDCNEDCDCEGDAPVLISAI